MPSRPPFVHAGVLVRQATEADRDALYDICVRTGDAGRDARHLLTEHRLYGHLWAGQYLTFAPDFAIVADRDGEVAGYVLGAPDTVAFEAALARNWWPPLQAVHPLPGTGTPKDIELIRRLHAPDHTDTRITAKYPSHLHINLLPAAQAMGLGRAMMGALFQLLREAGSIGVHLGVSPHNAHALGFYEHLGLRRHDSDGGVLFTERFGPI
jgi:ribosomal protein S18 acetylase RimI-like enzyme